LKIIITAVLILFAGVCKAQTPVYDITDYHNRAQDVYGAYHKDMNNLLNPFEGTYIYTNGNTSLKIVLQKKIMSSMNGYVYEDLIIGEYQYIENGIEKANTLNKLLINYANGWKYNIVSNHIITQGDIGCKDCLQNEKALMGGLIDGASENTAQLTIRRVTDNNLPAIKIFILWRMTQRSENTPASPHASIPGGSYTLIKQP